MMRSGKRFLDKNRADGEQSLPLPKADILRMMLRPLRERGYYSLASLDPGGDLPMRAYVGCAPRSWHKAFE
jgi:hypothetical protein